MPLARMMLSSVQRCSEKRRVVAAPSASANASRYDAASSAPVPATERTNRRRSMTMPPGRTIGRLLVHHHIDDRRPAVLGRGERRLQRRLELVELLHPRACKTEMAAQRFVVGAV